MYVHVLSQRVTAGPVPNLSSSGGFPSPQLPSPGLGPPQLVPTKVWAKYHTPEGKEYFYNKITKQSVWEMPPDFELIVPLPAGIANMDPPINNKGAYL